MRKKMKKKEDKKKDDKKKKTKKTKKTLMKIFHHWEFKIKKKKIFLIGIQNVLQNQK